MILLGEAVASGWGFDRWVGVLGALFGVVGFWLYQRAKRDPGPRYAVVGEPIITERMLSASREFGNLSLNYSGQPVTSASRVHVYVWNSGRGPIMKTDVPSGLNIALEDGSRILSGYVATSTRAACGFIVTPSFHADAELELEFVFMDYGDGAVVSILYEGSPGGVEVRGPVIGSRPGFTRSSHAPRAVRVDRSKVGPSPTRIQRFRARSLRYGTSVVEAVLLVFGGLPMITFFIFALDGLLRGPRAWVPPSDGDSASMLPVVFIFGFAAAAILWTARIRRMTRWGALPPAALYDVSLVEDPPNPMSIAQSAFRAKTEPPALFRAAGAFLRRR